MRFGPNSVLAVVATITMFSGYEAVGEDGADLAAVPFTRTLEGRAQQPIKIEIKRVAGSTEAPPNDAYHYDTTPLTAGLILFFRTSKDERYAKLVIESITESPPPELKDEQHK